MEKRTLGRTGLEVTVLGLGGAEIGFERKDVGDEAIERLLNTILDMGVTLIDTAECYSESEDLIGRFVGHRRSEFTLTTKIGHEVVPDAGPEWSVPQLEATVDRGLKRLRTDCVDVLQLHTCSLEDLKKGDVINVLTRARDAGKTRFIGYSGDNEAAEYAVELGVFDTLQTSFSLLDQKARRSLLDAAQRQNMGIIVKRPIANGMLGAAAPHSDYSKPYFERSQKIQWPEFNLPPVEVAMRYTLSHPVSAMIVGTKNIDHLRNNIETVGKGPLSPETVAAINAAWDAADEGWEQKS